MAEAAAQLQAGLDQLALLPANPERQLEELKLRSSLGAALFAMKGHAAPETGRVYARARELWEQLGSPSEFLHIPYGQSRYHTFRCEFDLARRLDEDLLHLSRQRHDSAGLILGHYSSGRNLRKRRTMRALGTVWQRRYNLDSGAAENGRRGQKTGFVLGLSCAVFGVKTESGRDQTQPCASRVFLAITKLASANRVRSCAVFLARPR